MRKKVSILIIMLSVFWVSCATTKVRDGEKWIKLAESSNYKEEKKLFDKRTNGLKYCGDIGINDFIFSSTIKPDPNCAYPASKLIIEEVGFFNKKKDLKQSLQELKVMQVTTDGFIVETPHKIIRTTYSRGGAYSRSIPYDNIIFIHKTDEEGIVDGSYLDNKAWLMYEYVGPYTYKTLTGSKTIHSFQKIPKDKYKKAFEGIESYSPLKDYLIRNELWNWIRSS